MFYKNNLYLPLMLENTLTVSKNREGRETFENLLIFCALVHDTTLIFLEMKSHKSMHACLIYTNSPHDLSCLSF